ncbi:putative aspartic peptidase A1 family, aspartic peptidase domain superfamily, xylanase inhibitor [Helianthus annuus]|uniref:Aspartic peptidase A1 family, aspartic peptidase domain superfamily, xylanase inhibitor n=1 Tax=Helianthus annuus TaxID=4232 RepID=A0A9K3NMC1_HELAN|nr:putative aspartic peptidase A1 family, aspartic peptidase domain superfamily, xylanase inhibitor [Helianthus annuus]KAJ0921854.1 putative aspartic peptidase A1 family, aspartic peptidase domain superfamily, xylanase inhibitor [Helianthus annuus]
MDLIMIFHRGFFFSGTNNTTDFGLQVFIQFGSQTEETQSQPSSAIPFEYCYELSPNQKTFEAPLMNLTMEGGDKYSVKNPFVFVPLEDGGTVFCLGIDKSEDVNIIGQNSS